MNRLQAAAEHLKLVRILIDQLPDEERELLKEDLSLVLDAFDNLMSFASSNEVSLSEIDGMIYALRHVRVHDEASIVQLKAHREANNAANALEEVASQFAVRSKYSESFAFRNSPYVQKDEYEKILYDLKDEVGKLKRVGDDLKSQISQSKEPIFGLLGFKIFADKMTYSYNIFGIILEGKASVPIGLLDRLISNLKTAGQKLVSRATAGVRPTLESLLSPINRFQALNNIVGTAHEMGSSQYDPDIHSIDDMVSHLIRIGQRPPKNLAAKARHLSLNSADLSDISLIEDCVNVTRINLDNNNDLSDVSPLTKIVHLKHLQLTDTAVFNIDFIKMTEFIEFLDLRGTNVSDLSPLQFTKNLQDLNLRASQVRSLDELSTLANLRNLNISLSRVQDLNVLQHLASLRSLDARETRGIDYSVISNAYSLEYLDISRTECCDISFIKNLRNLKVLRVGLTGVVNFEPVKHHSSLRYVYISERQRSACEKSLENSNIGIRVLKDEFSLM